MSPSTAAMERLAQSVGGEFRDGGLVVPVASWNLVVGTVYRPPYGEREQQVEINYAVRLLSRVILGPLLVALLVRVPYLQRLVGAPCSRFRLRFTSPDGFGFRVYRKKWPQRLGQKLGFQDVAIGTDAFDDAYIVKTNDEEKVRLVLEGLEDVIRTVPQDERFEIRQRRFWGGGPPEGVMELTMVDLWTVTSTEALEKRIEMFATTMDALHRHGSASTASPSEA